MRSDALILGFDTSAAHCAAALLSGDTVLAEVREDMARGQAERLVPLLEQVLRDGGKSWGDLDALAVGVGPGNFTGIRIAVATARGLALGLGIPAIGVSIFDARAEGLPRPLTVAEDARRGEVHVQAYAPEPGLPQILTAAEAGLHGTGALTGTAAEMLAAATGRAVLDPLYPLAVAIARQGARRVTQAGLARPAPLYLRQADAAPPSDLPPPLLP